MKNYESGTPQIDDSIRVEIQDNGPYLVFGTLPIKQQFIIPDNHGFSWVFRQGIKDYAVAKTPTALCRCGASTHKPYCDGSHLRADWDESLTAPHAPLLSDAAIIEGPTLNLSDNRKYCAFARFCDAKGDTWNLTLQSDDPKKRQLAIYTASHCPAGRLKEWDTELDKPFELQLKPAIGIIEDPALNVSGGLWLMGGIPVKDSTGYTYEVRNRVTLCRCGQSSNKPFCDGTHATMKFKDGLPEEMSDTEI